MTSSISGDELIRRLSIGDMEDGLAFELLQRIFDGYPVERLRPLLASDDDAVVKKGIWLASEIAPNAAPLMDSIASLLSHSDRYVRFYAVESVLTSSRGQNGEAIAQAIGLIDDPDPVVRAKVVQLMANASGEQLEAGEGSLAVGALRDLTHWLLNEMGESRSGVLERLNDDDRAVRLFALAAVDRLADSGLLKLASEAADDEVSSYARERLAVLRRPRL